MKLAKFLSPFFAGLSFIMHFFCCGLPAVAALLSLAGLLSVSSLQFEFVNFIHSYHIYILILAVIATALSGLFLWFEINSHAKHVCTTLKSKKKWFYISCFLVFVDISWFVVEEFVLHQHHLPHLHEHCEDQRKKNPFNHPLNRPHKH